MPNLTEMSTLDAAIQRAMDEAGCERQKSPDWGVVCRAHYERYGGWYNYSEECSTIADAVRIGWEARGVEYGIARPASMPDMSGKERHTLLTGVTFRSLGDAQAALRNVPWIRDREAYIVQRPASGEWTRVEDTTDASRGRDD